MRAVTHCDTNQGGPPAYIRRVRRSRFARAFSGILAVWLAICLAEPMQLHTCVMHGGLAMAGSMHGMGGGSMDRDAMSSGSTNRAHPAASLEGRPHHNDGTDDQSIQCICLGDCSGGRTPVGLTAAPVFLASLQFDVPTPVFSYVSPSLASPRFLLPFSNGPPSASSRA